jgi:hypothetical protein
MHLAGNMRLQFPDIPVVNSDAPSQTVVASQIRAPVLVIEVPADKDTAETPVGMQGLPGELGLVPSPVETLSLPYRFGGGRQMSFRYLWLR